MPSDILKNWDDLNVVDKKLFERQMEVYAAYLAYTDHEIGRVVQAIGRRRQRHAGHGRRPLRRLGFISSKESQYSPTTSSIWPGQRSKAEPRSRPGNTQSNSPLPMTAPALARAEPGPSPSMASRQGRARSRTRSRLRSRRAKPSTWDRTQEPA